MERYTGKVGAVLSGRRYLFNHFWLVDPEGDLLAFAGQVLGQRGSPTAAADYGYGERGIFGRHNLFLS
jgi:hypothetical protein